MASQLFTNITQVVNVREHSHLLRGKELGDLPVIENGYLIVENGIIAEYGEMKDFERLGYRKNGDIIDTSGQFVLPCWCDSHTHIVFSGSRENEFVDRIRGLSYSEISAKGGGILLSVKNVKEASENELFLQAWKRLEEVSRLGTGAIEIKSGYGLTLGDELKMLRVIKKLKEKSSLSIKSTFLGAHTYPLEYRENHSGYIDIIINKMLPAIAREGLADFIDVFCENGFFSADETETLCKAGMQYGLKPKLHVNQLSSIKGIQTGIKCNAISLDHLETLTQYEISLLSGWEGVSTLLPTAAFFLGIPLQAARELIGSGAAVALASDYNPGSSPSGNMNFVIALSCLQMRMLPEEAINAATLNGAYAMELGNELGSITIGKKANLIFTKPIPSVSYLPYCFANTLIERVMIGGEFIN